MHGCLSLDLHGRFRSLSRVACPISTGEGTRRVRLVPGVGGGGGGNIDRVRPSPSQDLCDEADAEARCEQALGAAEVCPRSPSLPLEPFAAAGAVLSRPALRPWSP